MPKNVTITAADENDDLSMRFYIAPGPSIRVQTHIKCTRTNGGPTEIVHDDRRLSETTLTVDKRNTLRALLKKHRDALILEQGL